MIRKYFLLILFFFGALIGNAQNAWQHYNWDGTSPKDHKGVSDSIYAYDVSRYKGDMYVGQNAEVAALFCAQGFQKDVLGGNFYKLPADLQSYLRKVYNTIIPDQSINKVVRIYLCRDADINASMNESGILRINVGMLARLNSEAELAMVMGHETGHFVNEDVIKGIGRKFSQSNNTGYLFFSLKQMSDEFSNLWFSREDESAADFRAIKYMKASPYSLKGGSELFRLFKREETRMNIMYGSRVKLLATHPDPGNRLKIIKSLSEDSLNVGKKNFVVDSLMFRKLKEFCFMETVNICLQENNLEDLSVMCFSKYLFEPDNHDNLAVLMESLRRQLLLGKEKNLEDKSFILAKYQTAFVEKSENYAFLNSKNPSILNHLSKGFLNFKKEDTLKIKATELYDQTVTEFTTYQEAYDYFKKKAASVGCKVCEHYKCFEENADVSAAAEYAKKNILFATNDCLAQANPAEAFKNELVVIWPAQYYKKDYLFNKISEQELGLLNAQLRDSLLAAGKKAICFYDLPYEDQHLLSVLAGLESFGDGSRLSCKEKKDWMKYAPELFSFFKRNNVNAVYVADFRLYQELGAKSPQVKGGVTDPSAPLGRQQEINYSYKICIPAKGEYSYIRKYREDVKNKEDETTAAAVERYTRAFLRFMKSEE